MVGFDEGLVEIAFSALGFTVMAGFLTVVFLGYPLAKILDALHVEERVGYLVFAVAGMYVTAFTAYRAGLRGP